MTRYLTALSVGLVSFTMAIAGTRAQSSLTANDVAAGHHLAAVVCAVCHLAAADQSALPLLHPPAPSFASIAQRKDINADSLKTFLITTHRDLQTQKGMPNPDLADFQVKEVIAYILSLRK